MTRTQSKSLHWKKHTKGRLTASKHHDVYTKLNTLAKHKSSYFPKVKLLVADLIYQNNNLDHIEVIKWGHDHEEDAVKAFYASKLSQQDFLLIKLYCFGTSPDKTMKCKYHGTSVVEIKCPHKIWDNTIKYNFKDLDFLTLNTDGIYPLINSTSVALKLIQRWS